MSNSPLPPPLTMMKSLEMLRKMNSSLEKAVDVKDKDFCSNRKCGRRTAGLVEANSFAHVYYGLPKGVQPWKICTKCQSNAEAAKKEAINEIKTKGDVFSIKCQALLKSTVAEVVNLELNDLEVAASSTDQVNKAPPASPSPIYSVSESKLTAVVHEMIERYSIKELIEKSKQTLAEEVEVLKMELADDDKTMDALAEQISRLMSDHNKLCRKGYVSIELGSVDIQNNGVVKVVEKEDLYEKLKQFGFSAAKEVLDFQRTVTPCIPEKTVAKVKELSEDSNDSKVSMLADLKKQNCENVPPNAPKNAPAPSTRKLVFGLPKVNQMVYAMHGDLLNYWIPAKIISILPISKNNSVVTVQLQNLESYRKSLQSNSRDLSTITKTLTGKQIAFTKPPAASVVLPFGTRVIAKFYDELGTYSELKGLFYAAIIAETPSPVNSDRYLVFFDDGLPQYTKRDDVIPVVETSESVWEDVHIDMQDFTEEFLSRYPNVRMLKATVGHNYKIEYNGKWMHVKVVGIDCSLMKVKYPGGSAMEYEWIYLGSRRIKTLYCASNVSAEPKAVNIGSKRDVQLTKQEIRPDEQPRTSIQTSAFKKEPIVFTYYETAGSTHKLQIPKKCPLPKKDFKPHDCTPSCVYVYNDVHFRESSPLVIPFYLGWAREFSGPSLSNVSYVSPCGVRLNKYNEIRLYNRITQSNIPIEFFSLEPTIDCLNQFHAERELVSIKDISHGKEWTPVQCINSINFESPNHLDYMSMRQPGEGVKINLDDGFLACCDCEDDCEDKAKCACWQSTLSGISFKNKPSFKGYEYRRLKNWIESGVYECNNKCKCRASACLNRVVQGKVKWPVQVFRTINKGWGVRALYDIPKGSFLCVYTGKLLNDAGATMEGLQNGDEYLADLDYIEVMELIKEGYESDCSDITDEEECDETGKSSKDLEIVWEGKKPQVARKSTAGRIQAMGAKRFKLDGQNSSKLKDNAKGSSKKGSSKPVRYRRYFGKSEKPYSVDGKSQGNFGRYFNHSCDPNVFIQNVFVDTHDPRFPWVAFFTKKDVKAGTELCWDYKYQVGSVPGKRLDCFCGARNCRGRLL